MKIFQKIVSGVVVTSLLTYYATPVLAYMNEETVYSNLDSTGKAYKSSVTTIIEDKDGEEIEQNETKKELPIETKITYYLDGKEMEAEKIAGQKGRVTIKLEFENKEKNGDVWTPFVVVAGLIIDNKTNSNLDIVNGKILTNGNTCIAVGMALPGMQESLGIDESKIKIPNSIEISMDTEKFETKNIMVYASPKLLGELNIEMADFDEIFDKVSALETASKALESGAVDLAEGIKSLDAGAVSLDNGIASLDNGIDTLKSGANDLNNGAVQLKNGTAEFATNSKLFNNGVSQVSSGVSTLNTQYSELDAGINTLNNKSTELQAGATQLKDGVGAVNAGVTTLKDGAGAINDGVTTLKDGAGAINAGVTSLKDGAGAINTGVNTLKSGAGDLDAGAGAVLNGINDVVNGLAPSMTESAKDAKKTALDEIIGLNENALGEDVTGTIADLQGKVSTYTNSLNQLPTSAELQAGVDAGAITQELADSYEQTRALLNGLITSLNTNISLLKLTQGNYTALTGTKASISKTIDDTEDLYNGLLKIQTGMKSVADGASSLSGGLTDLSTGTSNLTNGLTDLSAGTSNLSNGLTDLSAGTSNLSNGLTSLSEGTNNLVDGASKLSDGTVALSNGTASLTDGSSKVVAGLNSLDEGAGTLAENSQKLADASETISNGAVSLQDGTNSLQNGVNVLSNGSKQLKDGSLKLTEGTLKLVDGSTTLADGMKKFNDEGINKISNLIDSGKNLIRKVEKLEQISKDYTSFDSKGERDDLKFIAITDSVKIEEKTSNKNEKK